MPDQNDNNKIRWWQTKYTWFTILSVIIAFIFPLLMRIGSLYGAITALKQEVLIAWIAVEATIVGFFGLIFVHALASFRSTFDILARGLEKEREPKEASSYAVAWMKAHTNTIKNRTAYINHSLNTGIFLILSMLSLLLVFAVTSVELIFYFSYLSIGLLLLVCLPQILWTMNDLGKDPYQDWTQACSQTPNIH